MKYKILSIVFFLLTVFCLFYINEFSTETGVETAITSDNIAEYLANIFTQNPTSAQIDIIENAIRLCAHFTLFFILGQLSILTNLTFFIGMDYKYKIISSVFVVVLVSLCGFLDEWRKQFIDGRHFDLGEAYINIFSGIAGILIGISIMLAVSQLVFLFKKIYNKI